MILVYLDENNKVYKSEIVAHYNALIHSEAIIVNESDYTPFDDLNDVYYIDNKFIIKPKIDSLDKLSYLSKVRREELVKSIEVNYKGVIYQGDETSQDRISRTLNGLPDDTTTVDWKAKDNSIQKLNRIDLKEILFLAVQEQTSIWTS